MILAIGIDITEIDRFQGWCKKSKKSLKRLFSEEEIAYCCLEPSKSSERFAARFAAKEAFYKAYSSAFGFKVSLLNLCRLVEVCRNPIRISFDPSLLTDALNKRALKVHLSLTHSRTTAAAVVVFEVIQS